MNVIHLSFTPVSGSPIQIVNALNEHTNYKARLINSSPNYYGPVTFHEDLTLPHDKDEALKLIETADIIHIHQCIKLKYNEFGVDLSELQRRGKILLRHWHSEPDHFEKYDLPGPDHFEGEDIQQLVISQYHERYYPNAIMVPNIIHEKTRMTSVSSSAPEKHSIIYTPTNRFSPLERRWATKGYDLTLAALESISKETGVDYKILEGVSWEEAMKEKANSTIVIDDLVTGSYHRSGLEGLALGKPTFTWLDPRTTSVLSCISKTITIPFINVHLNNFSVVLKNLIESPVHYQQVSEYSKYWMDNYYSSKKLIKFYTNIYDQLIERKGKVIPKEGAEPPVFLKQKTHDLNFKANLDL